MKLGSLIPEGLCIKDLLHFESKTGVFGFLFNLSSLIIYLLKNYINYSYNISKNVPHSIRYAQKDKIKL